MKAYNLSVLKIKVVERESCLRLVQFGRGLPITCTCTTCAARNQTPEQAKESILAAA